LPVNCSTPVPVWNVLPGPMSVPTESGVGLFVAVPTYPLEPSGVTLSVLWTRLAVNRKLSTPSKFRVNVASVLFADMITGVELKTISAFAAMGAVSAAPARIADLDTFLDLVAAIKIVVRFYAEKAVVAMAFEGASVPTVP